MNKASSNVFCIYCGSKCNLTRDHIPAKNIFPTPRPTNLITVPCCKSCNIGFSVDDEWFRTLVACDPLSSAHSQAQRIWPTVRRQLLRSKNLGIISELLRQSFNVDESGNIDLNMRAVEMRLAKVLTRILKGLYFTEFRAPLPDSWETKIDLENSFAEKDDVAMVEWCFTDSPSFRLKKIGDGVFRYLVCSWPEKGDGYAWFLSFFDSIHFLCTTAEVKMMTDIMETNQC